MNNLPFPRSFLSILLVIAFILTSNAQLQNANWYFGNQSGVNFNDGTAAPTALMNSGMNTTDGCASVSDNNGNLLFYTNGIDVWKNNHQTVSGSSMFGSASVSQSVIIVPVSGSGRNFYIFTNQGPESGLNGLSYSKLRMTQDDPDDPYTYSLSNVNAQLLTIASEKLTSVYNPNDDTSWVVSFAPSKDPNLSDTFYVFKVDEYGVTLQNQFMFTFRREAEGYTGGQMKISPDGTKLAMTHNNVEGDENVYTFDFDIVSGTISLMNTYDIGDVFYCYGLEFSPDSDKIFVTATHLGEGNSAIIGVYQIWYRNSEALYMPVQFVGGQNIDAYSLQLALDGKIYAATNSDKLHCISNPNGLSQNASFECDAIDLNGKLSIKGLPQFVSQLPYYNSDRGVETKYTILENPFEEDLRIKFHVTGEFDLELQNMSGSNVFSKEFTIYTVDSTKSFDVEDLNDGMYILTITDQDHDNEEWSATVIKVDD